jgi:dihydrofolate synthase/folylpolyglutamate synthase
MQTIVCTQNSTARALSADTLGEIAAGIFGSDRVVVERRLDDAIERAVTLADAGLGDGIGLGGGGVLVTGSVITAGEARTLLGGRR